MSDLFTHRLPPHPVSPPARYLRVAVERGIDRVRGKHGGSGDGTLTYSTDEPVQVGERVEVPLGRGDTRTFGIVVETGGPELLDGDGGGRKSVAPARIKPILARAGTAIPERLVALARWMAAYYVCPLGMVLAGVVPAAVKKRTGLRRRVELRPAPSPPDPEPKLPLATRAAWDAVRAIEPEAFPFTPPALAARIGARSLTAINRLVRFGLLDRSETRVIAAADPAWSNTTVEPGRPRTPLLARSLPSLTPQQSAIVQGVAARFGSFSVHLLRGVTGSGKTEVYLRLIAHLLDGAGRSADDPSARAEEQPPSALVLVPEIALTPQTAGRFLDRFGHSRVAVLHSGLAGAQRHRQWALAASGAARVVVGARSAVFAPLRNVGLIIVDEEHDASYKQDQLPRYHARDAAIKRAQLEGCPVLLGSATPSLESWANATVMVDAASPCEPCGMATALHSHGSTLPRSTTSQHVSLPSAPKGRRDVATGEAPSARSADQRNPWNAASDKPRPGGAEEASLARAPLPESSLTKTSRISHQAAPSPKYRLWHLTDRVAGGALPPVQIVDIADERRAHAETAEHMGRQLILLGPTLRSAVRRTLAEGGQVLLLINRRGFANYLACPSVRCGWTMRCDNCDATMVLHKGSSATGGLNPPSTRGKVGGGFVRCHHCLAERRRPETCPLCNARIIILGAGTQRVELELARLFGLVEGETMLRLDSDSMHSARDYFAALSRFASGEIKLLVGTQMIAKGLDYPNVRLVGVVDADTAANLPDFRAAERTFQLVSQVAGRAGRGVHPGRVIVQTLNPAQPAIRLAAAHDYPAFAAAELALRRESGLPPITRMARIVVRDEDPVKAWRAAESVAAALRAVTPPQTSIRIDGPAPCPIARIGGFHRLAIDLAAPRRAAIQSALTAVRAQGLLKSDAHTAVDVDPVALM